MNGFFILIFVLMNTRALFKKNSFYLAPTANYFANRIRRTGSPFTNDIYVCTSEEFEKALIHDYIIIPSKINKQIGDTCRLWLEYKDYEGLYFCWEGFCIDETFFKIGNPISRIVSSDCMTRLVLTEKNRFRQEGGFIYAKG